MKTFTITGKTFAAKELLKAAGFTWDGAAWMGGESEAEELRRIGRHTYKASYGNAMSGIEIVEIATASAPESATSKPIIFPSAVAYGCSCTVCGERITSRTVDTNYARGSYCGCEGA
jgi:hypothetical protein